LQADFFSAPVAGFSLTSVEKVLAENAALKSQAQTGNLAITTVL